uniref:Spermatogenesis associated 17 n=1 Tax=Neolamprologus brichardi TaxID=32507 RepID=A0A3Q4GHX1_NEOBR
MYFREADENREKENQAATQIQSWFRGCKVRAYLSHLHKKAIIIQKIWRGFTARALSYLNVTFKLHKNFCNPTQIQRTWRGFFVRKYIHNFYARKKYMEGLVMKNELVRRELDQLEELQKRERECLDMVKEHTAKVCQAHRLHHLLSTKQCPGVFNSPFRPAPHEMELLLRQQVKYQAPTRLASRGKACLLGIPSSTSSSFPETLGSPLIKTSRTYSSRPILPPIANKTQQQHLHCRELMLCLQTSYMHLEEEFSVRPVWIILLDYIQYIRTFIH